MDIVNNTNDQTHKDNELAAHCGRRSKAGRTTRQAIAGSLNDSMEQQITG